MRTKRVSLKMVARTSTTSTTARRSQKTSLTLTRWSTIHLHHHQKVGRNATRSLLAPVHLPANRLTVEASTIKWSMRMVRRLIWLTRVNQLQRAKVMKMKKANFSSTSMTSTIKKNSFSWPTYKKNMRKTLTHSNYLKRSCKS